MFMKWWRYNSIYSLISALDGVSGQLYASAALSPGKEPTAPIEQEPGLDVIEPT
jgi:hypothetical protein